MSPALARAQQGDLQAAMGGNVGTMGPGGMTGIVPGGKGFFFRLFKKISLLKEHSLLDTLDWLINFKIKV